jgi:predicted hydrocarbon binding protein
MGTTENLKYLQGSMMFLASIANGLEELVGRGAPSVTFRAGRTVGMGVEVENKETDLIKAFDIVQKELYHMGIHWDFETYKKKSDPDLMMQEDDETHLRLVFRNCMVRSCQFYYGHPQKNSLCMLQHGLFCGILQQVYGAWADYDPIHSGENACIGMLKVKARR